MADALNLSARIHALRVESTTELVGIPDRFGDLEWLALHLHAIFTRLSVLTPEAEARIRAHKPVMEPVPLMIPRDNETDIDKLQAEASDLFRQLRGIRDRLNKLEASPLDVADQLTTLDQRMTDMETRFCTLRIVSSEKRD